MDYKQKYLKYKEKYLNEKIKKFQLGGVKKIMYDCKITKLVNDLIINKDEDSINNLKQSIYSCIYMIMTSEKKPCDLSAPNVNCERIAREHFPFLTSSDFVSTSYSVYNEKINNNLIVYFDASSVMYCDHYVNELFNFFIYLYDFILLQITFAETPYNYIHIVGHSMGASTAILFSYFIMIIEKSSASYFHVPSSEYFSVNYDLPLTYDLEPFGDIFYEFKTTFHLENKIVYNKEDNFRLIREKAEKYLKNNRYSKIGNKISVCVTGAFPVLFKKDDVSQISEYLEFFNNRIINFSNCSTYEEIKEKAINANIECDFCDDKIFDIILRRSPDTILAELVNVNVINIDTFSKIKVYESPYKSIFNYNGVNIIRTMDPKYSLDERTISSELHRYKNIYNKLKTHIRIVDE